MRKSIDRMELVHDFLKRAFSGSLHAKRILSLANGTLGVLTGASLAVSVIGHGLAQARGLMDRHAIKQVDRLLSNAGVVVWDLFAPWAREVVGQRKAIVVAMDWTDFDADNQATLALSLITRHGRATPLLWLTVDKDELKDQRNDFEDLCLTRLKAILPEGVAVTILADRGFGDVKLFEFLQSLGFGYVIAQLENANRDLSNYRQTMDRRDFRSQPPSRRKSAPRELQNAGRGPFQEEPGSKRSNVACRHRHTHHTYIGRWVQP